MPPWSEEIATFTAHPHFYFYLSLILPLFDKKIIGFTALFLSFSCLNSEELLETRILAGFS
ncbi:hypothetical protein HMPREF9372_1347 [Sporosarcina newyorkensis 2681]|uniref:Uncharacterized protein n=1 Tax=Sporosarcina newyorkensis 2681 TaxID=1027292 RepID=F9DRB7_9BACL|nr:hypothetical protein HMPREF9372_1347 [Sporosarcina newyorkensis 2681]